MTSFDRYELQGTLGEGGFATVYRALDPASNSPDEAVAITREGWETLCYSRDGTLVENRTESARDTCSLRQVPAGWRITADRVDRLSLTRGRFRHKRGLSSSSPLQSAKERHAKMLNAKPHS